jgi:glycogen debranching enzyme
VSSVIIRPEQRYAWRGPSLVITDIQGECGGEPLSGYYFREARHLGTLRLEINGGRPWLCEAGSPGPDRLDFGLVYPERTTFGGGGSGQSGDAIERDQHGIPFRSLDLRLSLQVGVAGLTVSLLLTNRALEALDLDVAWRLGADFADIQEAHGGERLQEAEIQCEAEGNVLRFRYVHPGLPLETRITAAGPGGWQAESDRLAAHLRLKVQETAECILTIEPVDPEAPLTPEDVRRREERLRTWLEELVQVQIPGNAIAERIVRRNVRDLASFPLLEGAEDEWLAPQAGMPLYPALFGRDALTVGWQAAFLDQGTSLQASLTRVGRLQSRRFDPWRDEEPGRLPYQVRGGPLARLGLNPFAAYYADHATPLMFVISLAHLFAWSGDKEVLRRHWDTARRILDWARTWGDPDGDGFLEYDTLSPQGAKNQGWKDSGNAIIDEGGRSVPSPLGTCELQGYWFAAQQLMAFLAWSLGEREDAQAHWRAARKLKERFNRVWWLEDEGFFAMALGPDKRLVRSLGSNAGHCLASGIIADEHVPAVVDRLFAPDLFSGWGIRTLSSAHPAYSPLSYHRGTVWAVENASIALGLRRYGFDARTAQLAEALFALADLYPEDRIPECVGGYDRRERPFPGAYPRANTPQTWNASAFPLLVHALLGLQPVAPLDLLVVDPALPAWLPEVVLHGLRLGGATLTLRAWRDQDGASHAEIVKKKGTVHLLRQPPPESLTAGALDRLGALFETLRHH